MAVLSSQTIHARFAVAFRTQASTRFVTGELQQPALWCPKGTNLEIVTRLKCRSGLVMDIGKYSHITPALYDLHWLPIHVRIHFKILLLAFKVIHGQAPTYLSSLVSVKPKSYYSLRSNCSTLFDPPNGKMLVTLGGLEGVHFRRPHHNYGTPYRQVYEVSH